MTEPGRMSAIIASVIKTGAGRPGMSAVADGDVGGGKRLVDGLGLAAPVFLAHVAGVAVLALGGLVERGDLDEPRPQALDLLLDRGANVEGGDDGAQPARGGDRLQAGHAGAEDEDVGRRDGAGGGHHHRHRPVVLDRRVEHRLVAGEVALRAERIHALGSGNARQELERHGGQPARRVGGHQAGIGGGREEADQEGAVLHQADLVRPVSERRLGP